MKNSPLRQRRLPAKTQAKCHFRCHHSGHDQALVALANEPPIIVAQNQDGDWYQLDNGLKTGATLISGGAGQMFGG